MLSTRMPLFFNSFTFPSLFKPHQLKTLTTPPPPSLLQSHDPFLPSLSTAHICYSNSKHFNFEFSFEDDDDDDEIQNEEELMQRFYRESKRDGLVRECRRRMFFENHREKRKRKSREAAIKYRRWYRPKEQEPEVRRRKKKEDDEMNSDDDNWEV